MTFVHLTLPFLIGATLAYALRSVITNKLTALKTTLKADVKAEVTKVEEKL
jgi:hypothetical protein